MFRDRERMVREQIEARGVNDARVLEAMRKVERHLFVENAYVKYAYRDQPLPLAEEQTISQPFIVAHMTELLQLKPSDRVLEIGTGSGYQTAVLAELAEHVFSIEVLQELAETARARLKRLGYQNIEFLHGDGHLGWPEAAPFDGIIVTAAPRETPEALLKQLKIGARLVIPVGRFKQELRMYVRTTTGFDESCIYPVRFVPMVH